VEKNIDLTERTLALYQVNTVMSKWRLVKFNGLTDSPV